MLENTTEGTQYTNDFQLEVLAPKEVTMQEPGGRLKDCGEKLS